MLYISKEEFDNAQFGDDFLENAWIKARIVAASTPSEDYDDTREDAFAIARFFSVMGVDPAMTRLQEIPRIYKGLSYLTLRVLESAGPSDIATEFRTLWDSFHNGSVDFETFDKSVYAINIKPEFEKVMEKAQMENKEFGEKEFTDFLNYAGAYPSVMENA